MARLVVVALGMDWCLDSSRLGGWDGARGPYVRRECKFDEENEIELN